jgi:hypothetical protein
VTSWGRWDRRPCTSRTCPRRNYAAQGDLIFSAIGKADGTFLAYGPDRNLPTLLGWLRTVAPESAGAPDVHNVLLGFMESSQRPS